MITVTTVSFCSKRKIVLCTEINSEKKFLQNQRYHSVFRRAHIKKVKAVVQKEIYISAQGSGVTFGETLMAFWWCKKENRPFNCFLLIRKSQIATVGRNLRG